jgi:hypothetical protein
VLEKKKPNRKSRVVDVSADNPEGAMERFTDGLKKVVSAPIQAKPHRVSTKSAKR